MPLHCSHDEKMVREHTLAISVVTEGLKGFMARYDNDHKECADRYRNDRFESRDWRTSIDKRLDKQDGLLKEISDFLQVLRPAYNSGTRIAGIIVLGALGIIFTLIWKHVTK